MKDIRADITATKIYFPALEGMRGVAISLVVLYHCFSFTGLFRFGWIGVDMFFVLSGFLITRILLNTVNAPNYLQNFYVRRILRIFPLYYAVLVILFFVLPVLVNAPYNFLYYLSNQHYFWLYIQNWLLIVNPGDKLLNHFWSLALEEQYYLVWPLIVLFIKDKKKIAVSLVVTLIILNIFRIFLWQLHIPGFPYTSLFKFTRIDGLCVGSLLATLYTSGAGLNKKRNITVFFLIIVLFNISIFLIKRYINPATPYYSSAGYTTIAFFSALLVIQCLVPDSIVYKIFAFPILKFLGRISYGLYIFHWIVYHLLSGQLSKYIADHFHILQPGSDLLASFICVFISVVISIFSYQYFEKYFLHLKEKLTVYSVRMN